MDEKLRAFLKVIGVFLILTGIWALYRLWSVDLIIHNGEISWEIFFATQIAFQPLLTLLPIFLIVRFLERRRIWSIGLSRQKLVRNAFFGIFLSLFKSFLYLCLSYVLFVPLGAGPIAFDANPDNLGLASIFLMPLTFILVVGPSEEIESRGYFQTRLHEHFGPRFSITFPSLLFALAHIPIDILIWRYDVWTILFHLLGVFISGSLMGYLYYRSGVLAGPIFLHAFQDIQSSTLSFSFDYQRLGLELRYGIEGVTWAIATTLTFLLIRFSTSKLGLAMESLPWKTTAAQQNEKRGD
ncbi:MAG: CPBP family intramembrane metalloprotease [Candidatus Bathyarchaeota archaeon]|nr:MAG: CPBP family intramembrane metalloprotease [Candidatus Bathyarchaeota archaeon]